METLQPWNKDRIIGQKLPLKLKEIWAIRIRLQLSNQIRQLALFNLAIDSKLRGCDLLKLKVSEISQGGRISSRATVLQKKTQRPVQFEITEQTRESVSALIAHSKIRYDQYLFQSRNRASEHLSTRQYARIVWGWVTSINLDPAAYGTHSMRRTKATLIYKRTKNLRAVQLLLGHTKLESTVRYHSWPDWNFNMNFASTALLALAMSTDAFAAAIGKGASLQKPKISEALRTGLIFGTIEALTPLIGWAIGQAATSYVSAWDHWIAFTLLVVLGLRMIHEGFSEDEPEVDKPSTNSFMLLAITAFATSIDAMAVGVGLAFINVNIWVTAAAIGLATFTMVTIGIMVGRVLGAIVGKRAEVFGGLVLIGIGSYILYDHIYIY